MRYWLLLWLVLLPFNAFAGGEISNKMGPLILEGDFAQAIVEGEQLMAEYKETRPPVELYYYLFLAYANLGKTLRAEDIKRIMIQEYNYHFPVGKKVLSKGEIYQVGAFRSQGNARRLAEKLNRRGISAWILFDNEFYKVRFSCSDNCRRVISKVQALGVSPRKIK